MVKSRGRTAAQDSVLRPSQRALRDPNDDNRSALIVSANNSVYSLGSESLMQESMSQASSDRRSSKSVMTRKGKGGDWDDDDLPKSRSAFSFLRKSTDDRRSLTSKSVDHLTDTTVETNISIRNHGSKRSLKRIGRKGSGNASNRSSVSGWDNEKERGSPSAWLPSVPTVKPQHLRSAQTPRASSFHGPAQSFHALTMSGAKCSRPATSQGVGTGEVSMQGQIVVSSRQTPSRAPGRSQALLDLRSLSHFEKQSGEQQDSKEVQKFQARDDKYNSPEAIHAACLKVMLPRHQDDQHPGVKSDSRGQSPAACDSEILSASHTHQGSLHQHRDSSETAHELAIEVSRFSTNTIDTALPLHNKRTSTCPKVLELRDTYHSLKQTLEELDNDIASPDTAASTSGDTLSDVGGSKSQSSGSNSLLFTPLTGELSPLFASPAACSEGQRHGSPRKFKEPSEETQQLLPAAPRLPMRQLVRPKEIKHNALPGKPSGSHRRSLEQKLEIPPRSSSGWPIDTIGLAQIESEILRGSTRDNDAVSGYGESLTRTQRQSLVVSEMEPLLEELSTEVSSSPEPYCSLDRQSTRLTPSLRNSTRPSPLMTPSQSRPASRQLSGATPIGPCVLRSSIPAHEQRKARHPQQSVGRASHYENITSTDYESPSGSEYDLDDTVQIQTLQKKTVMRPISDKATMMDKAVLSPKAPSNPSTVETCEPPSPSPKSAPSHGTLPLNGAVSWRASGEIAVSISEGIDGGPPCVNIAWVRTCSISRRHPEHRSPGTTGSCATSLAQLSAEDVEAIACAWNRSRRQRDSDAGSSPSSMQELSSSLRKRASQHTPGPGNCGEQARQGERNFLKARQVAIVQSVESETTGVGRHLIAPALHHRPRTSSGGSSPSCAPRSLLLAAGPPKAERASYPGDRVSTAEQHRIRWQNGITPAPGKQITPRPPSSIRESPRLLLLLLQHAVP